MARAVRVAVACQGGGSHAAFTAGVLKTLLREEAQAGYEIMAFSGTSGGALSALLAWYGLLTGGADAAIRLLDDFWRDNIAASPYEQMSNEMALTAARSPLEVKGSPYEFPLSWAIDGQLALARMFDGRGGWGPRERFVDLGKLLEKHIAFEHGSPPRRVVIDAPPVRTTRLLIGAVDIISGEFEAFDSADVSDAHADTFDAGGISLEAALASAALPQFFKAVRIGERAYWDGLFSQNPPINDLLVGPHVRSVEDKPDEIWVIQINAQTGREPTTPVEIEERRGELAGNLSLNQDIRFIRTVNALMRQRAGADPSTDAASLMLTTRDGRKVYKPVDVHRIPLRRDLLAGRIGRKLDTVSKLDRSERLIEGLVTHGQEQATEFLNAWQAGSLVSET